MKTVVIEGWIRDAEIVSAIECVRDATGSTLLQAKQSMEKVLAGEVVRLSVCDAVADMLADQLQAVGVMSRVESAPP